MEKFIYKFVAISLLLLINLLAFAQNDKLVELQTLLQSNPHDTAKIQALLDIGDIYEYSIPDSALYYYLKAQDIAQKNSKKHIKFKQLNITALRFAGLIHFNRGDFSNAIVFFMKSTELSAEISEKKAETMGLMNAGVSHVKQGNYDVAMDLFNKALEITIERKDTLTASKIHGNIGEIWWNRGYFDKAIDYYLKQVRVAEQYNDISGMYTCYNNLASIFSTQLDYVKAIEYFKKSLHLIEQYSDKKTLSAALNNIGIIYSETGDQAKALEYYNQALEISKSINDKDGMSYSIGSMGTVYSKQKNYVKAIEYYVKQLAISREIGNKNVTSTVLSNLAGAYFSLAMQTGLDERTKQLYLQKSIDYAHEGHIVSEQIGALQSINNNSRELVKAHTAAGNTNEALTFFNVYIGSRDSLFKDEKTKAVVEMQTIYETEKQQQEIEKQQLVIEKQEIDNRRQRLQRNFFIVGSILLMLLALVVFNGYQQKKRSNAIITEKNSALEQANEEIAAQRDLVFEQKEHIEEIHGELTSSIRYARRIQAAVLPSQSQMDDLLGDHFALFKPKDIVSGDFYWATRVKNLVIFCAADCTGHGVPGAFMSMLGVSFLNDIVHKENVTSASEVLDHLRASIIDALKQKGEGNEQKDGMDMGLCVINIETREMQFAGGYNPCWIIPSKKFKQQRLVEPAKNDVENSEEDVIQIKADKMPIAIHKKMQPFTNHAVQLYPGDQVYLMSDGFQDQFGGPSGKKFMVKNLRELVAANCQLPMKEQLELLDKTFEEWRNGVEQVDDVTILGIRI